MRRLERVKNVTMLAGVVLGLLLGCTEQATESLNTQVPSISLSLGGCWPISLTCLDRQITNGEKDQFVRMAAGMSESGDPLCSQIKQALAFDIGVGNVRVDLDDTGDLWGDRHNGPGITHITAWALRQSPSEVKKTLIHETAHSLGASEAKANELMESCYGTFEI
jgi:hypothetical protein